MRLVVIEFISLDGVIQAPGGAEEDPEGGFAHGGWSLPYFDPGTMGAAYDEALQRADALLFGRRTWQTSAAAWPERAADPFADCINALPQICRPSHADRRPDDLEYDLAARRRRAGSDR